MSWYRIVVIYIVALFYAESIYAKKQIGIVEDQLIMQGILYENYQAYENAYAVYKRLFDSTGESVYLFKEATASLLSRRYIMQSISRLKAWEKKHPDTLEVRRLLIPLYLTAQKIKSAQKEAEYLLEQSSDIMDLDLVSNSFLYAGDFKRALKILQQIYKTAPKEDILLKIVGIMDEFTDQREKAIQLLETHRHMNISSKDIYIKLLILYQKQKDVDGIIRTYKALYELEEKSEYLTKIVDAYIYKGDPKGAISYLESKEFNGVLLYELYKLKKEFSKALEMIDDLYKKDKDPKWFAEKGILTFEAAKNKDDKKMLKDSLAYFEKAIKLGNDDSLYLNYYGYTLIDKDIDIKKGIRIIQDALKQQPHNTYYLDSLAWGYYKIGKCAKAKSLMQKVVDEEGLKEPEIIEHWNAIKQCR